MPRDVIIAPYLQRRAEIARGYEMLGEGVEGAGRAAQRGMELYIALQEREKERQAEEERFRSKEEADQIRFEEEMYHQASRDAGRRAQELELNEDRQAHDAAQSELDRDHRVREAIIARSFQASEGAADRAVQSERYAKDDERENRRLRLEEDRVRLAKKQLKVESELKYRKLQTDIRERTKKSGMGIYRGRIEPWHKVADKPGAQELLMGEADIATKMVDTYRKQKKTDADIVKDLREADKAATILMEDIKLNKELAELARKAQLTGNRELKAQVASSFAYGMYSKLGLSDEEIKKRMRDPGRLNWLWNTISLGLVELDERSDPNIMLKGTERAFSGTPGQIRLSTGAVIDEIPDDEPLE